jgi:phosphoribosylglycinamide formyltransferase-1
MNTPRTPVVILLSGRGSNLQAIIEQMTAGRLAIDIRAVISNRAEAQGLALARAARITTQVIESRDYSDRDQFDAALMRAIDAHAPRLVILAGFMRILGADFIRHYAQRLINIHPSLLPAFKGLNTHARALQAGAKRHGASVHFVTPGVDDGPIIIQSALDVLPGDTAETLAQRVLQLEHRIYPQAIQWFVAGRLSLDNGNVLLDGERRPEQGLPMASA